MATAASPKPPPANASGCQIPFRPVIPNSPSPAAAKANPDAIQINPPIAYAVGPSCAASTTQERPRFNGHQLNHVAFARPGSDQALPPPSTTAPKPPPLVIRPWIKNNMARIPVNMP